MASRIDTVLVLCLALYPAPRSSPGPWQFLGFIIRQREELGGLTSLFASSYLGISGLRVCGLFLEVGDKGLGLFMFTGCASEHTLLRCASSGLGPNTKFVNSVEAEEQPAKASPTFGAVVFWLNPRCNRSGYVLAVLLC